MHDLATLIALNEHPELARRGVNADAFLPKQSGDRRQPEPEPTPEQRYNLAKLAQLAAVVRRDGHLGLYDSFSPDLICAAQSAAEARYFAKQAPPIRFDRDGSSRSSYARDFARAAFRYIARFVNLPETADGHHEI